MISLNSLLQYAQERWSKAPQVTRLVMAGSTAVALILIAIFVGWKGAIRFQPLFAGRNFTQQELVAVESALSRSGLNEYRVQPSSEGQVVVDVPSLQRARYIAAIVEADALPLNFDLDLKAALDKSSPFESSTQWKARIELAKQRELAKILCSMTDIDEATVQFDEEIIGGLKNQRRVRAMVAIRPHPSVDLDAGRIRSIRQLIAASKAFLDASNVTVMDLKTGCSYAGSQELDPAMRQSLDYTLRKSDLEREWTAKVKRVLTFIPSVEVATNVEFEVVNHRLPQDKLQQDRLQPSASLEHLRTDNLDFWPSNGLLKPSNIMVSIGVPHSYFHRVRSARGPRLPMATPDAASIRKIERETNEKIQRLVSGLLPSNLPADGCRIAVVSFPDVQARTPDNTKGRWSVVARNPLVAGCILGIVTIGILLGYGFWQDLNEDRMRLQAESAKALAEPPPIQVHPMSTHVNHSLDPGNPLTPQGGEDERDEELPVGNAIHKELTQLVREDPDAAAKMLGEWVRRAS